MDNGNGLMNLAYTTIVLILVVLVSDTVDAQQFGRGRGGQRNLPDRSAFPMWENADGFERDVFTFGVGAISITQFLELKMILTRISMGYTMIEVE